MSQNLSVATATEPASLVESDNGAFASISNFEDAQRMANMLSKSSMVPDTFKGNLGDCVIALEISRRIGASVLAVMQNLYIVHGKPAWSSQFLIACVNASRRFSPLRYRMTGTRGDASWGCVAWATDKSGEVLESPEVTIGMATAEGWVSKNGSKWKTMPELMLRYRTATLFARTYAPELTMGIRTEDEVLDIESVRIVDTAPVVTDTPRKRLFDAPTVEAQPAPVAVVAAPVVEDQIPGAEVAPAPVKPAAPKPAAPKPAAPKPAAKAPAPTAPVEVPSIQSELAAVMSAAGYTFTEFQSWCVESGNLPAAGSLSTYDELDGRDCQKWLRSKAGLLHGLATLTGRPAL